MTSADDFLSGPRVPTTDAVLGACWMRLGLAYLHWHLHLHCAGSSAPPHQTTPDHTTQLSSTVQLCPARINI